jgi:hypothetical protein
VPPAQRNGDLVAGPWRECGVLHKAKMVGICGSLATDQARMLDDRSNVIAVTHPDHAQRALGDAPGPSLGMPRRPIRFLKHRRP